MPTTNTYFSEKKALPSKITGRLHQVSVEIDFALSPGVVTDIVRVIGIPANTVIFAADVVIVTGQGATCTADFGDDTSGTSLITAVNLETADATIQTPANTVTCPVKYYSAANNIVLTLGHTTSTAKIVVSLLLGFSHKNLT